MRAFSIALGLGLAAQAACADPVADFYAAKRVMLVVATPPGGPYDICARLPPALVQRTRNAVAP